MYDFWQSTEGKVDYTPCAAICMAAKSRQIIFQDQKNLFALAKRAFIVYVG